MRNLLIAATIILFLITAGYVVKNSFLKNGQIACTQEAMLCPDGSYVGRSGPKCEFAPCPTGNISGTGTLTGKVNVGPLCPVEPCPVDQKYPVFADKVLIAHPKEGSVVQIKIAANGSFTGKLKTGQYSLDITNCEWFGCKTTLPKEVTILPNQTTNLSIDIDTGIR